MSEEVEGLSSATSRRPPDAEDFLEPEQSQQQLSHHSGTVLDLSKKKTKQRWKQRNVTLNTIEKAVHRTTSAKTQLVEGEYEIEQIRMIKVLNKYDLRFLVKWQGWPEEDNTWEPFANIRTCLFHLRSFYQEGLGNKRLVKQPAWKMLTGCLLLEGLIDTKTGQFVLSESEGSSEEDDEDSLSISGDSSSPSSHDSEIPITKKKKRERRRRSSSTKPRKTRNDQEQSKHKSREASEVKTAENLATADTAIEASNIEQHKGSSSSTLNNQSNKRRRNSNNGKNRSNNSANKQKHHHHGSTNASGTNEHHADQTDQSSKSKDDLNGQQSISRKRLKMSLPQSQQEASGPQFFRSTKEYLETIQKKDLQPFSYRDTHPSLGQSISDYTKTKQDEFAKRNPEIISELRATIKEKNEQNRNQLEEELENKQTESKGEVQDPPISQEQVNKEQGEGNNNNTTTAVAAASEDFIDKITITTPQDPSNNDPANNILPAQSIMISTTTSSTASVPPAEDNMEWKRLNELMLEYPCSELVRSHWGRIEQDEPSAIIQMDSHPWKEGQLIYLVSWDPRKKKRQLLPSWVDANSFKLAFPQIVIDFYQSFVKLSNSSK